MTARLEWLPRDPRIAGIGPSAIRPPRLPMPVINRPSSLFLVAIVALLAWRRADDLAEKIKLSAATFADRKTAPTRKNPPKYPRNHGQHARHRTARRQDQLRLPFPRLDNSRFRRRRNRVHRVDADLRSVGGAGGEFDLKITVNEHFGRSPWCPWQSERGGERHWGWRAIHWFLLPTRKQELHIMIRQFQTETLPD